MRARGGDRGRGRAAVRCGTRRSVSAARPADARSIRGPGRTTAVALAAVARPRCAARRRHRRGIILTDARAGSSVGFVLFVPLMLLQSVASASARRAAPPAEDLLGRLTARSAKPPTAAAASLLATPEVVVGPGEHGHRRVGEARRRSPRAPRGGSRRRAPRRAGARGGGAPGARRARGAGGRARSPGRRGSPISARAPIRRSSSAARSATEAPNDQPTTTRRPFSPTRSRTNPTAGARVAELVPAAAVAALRAHDAAEVEPQDGAAVRGGELVADRPQQRVVLRPAVARVRVAQDGAPPWGPSSGSRTSPSSRTPSSVVKVTGSIASGTIAA